VAALQTSLIAHALQVLADCLLTVVVPTVCAEFNFTMGRLPLYPSIKEITQLTQA